jgi:hypothetical protein
MSNCDYVLWSGERYTINANNRRGVQTCVEHGKATGIVEIYPRLGPMMLKDVTGHRAAVYMLMDTLNKGKYHKDHKQFD